MSFKVFILFSIFSVLILIPFLLDPDIINGNDLNGNIVPLLHFKESILIHHQFPQWNQYINQGIPTTADPLYGIYNPIIGIPILLFQYPIAIKVTYFISVLLACISMFLLTRLFKIRHSVSLIIALTFASCTYLSSRIIAGHLEKVVSFAFLPLFLFCLIKVTKEKNVLWAGVTAAILSLILFTGDIYNTLYCLYSLAAVILFYIIKDKKTAYFLALTILLFLLFSSIKIFPMIELQNYISKIKEPFIGGLNPLSMFYNLFFPFDSFLTKIFPVKNFSTDFGWWESLAFIGPISLCGVFYIFNSVFKKHDSKISILIVLTCLFVILATPNSKINPLHYLISHVGILQYFHVPSRILALWGVIILLCFGIFMNSWKKKNLAIILLVINLIVVFLFSRDILKTRQFDKINKDYSASLTWIKNNNPNSYYTVHETSQGDIPQDKAYLNHILLLQSNYGLFIKGSLGEKYNFRGNNPYEDIKPGFLISNTSTTSAVFKKINSFGKNIIIYKDSRAQPFAKIDKIPQKVSFSVDKITIISNSQKLKKLILLESSYPGWNVFVDGKKEKLLAGRFLAVNTLEGKHKYEFIYSSNYFHYGFLLSTLSIVGWGLFVSRIKVKRYLKKKKIFTFHS